MTEIDFTEDAQNNSQEMTEDIFEAVTKYEQLLADKKKIDILAKETAEQIRFYEDEFLPDLMQKNNISELKVNSGKTLSRKFIIAGSIPSATAIAKAKGDERQELIMRRHEALTWIMENEPAILKTDIDIQFGKGESCDELVKALTELSIDFKREENVHAQTLNKILKDRIQNGEEVPVETFKLFTGERAQLK